MTRRLDSARRILALRETLQSIAEWRLLAVERESAEVAAAREDLARFVEGEAGLAPDLGALLGKRRASLDGAAAALSEAKAQQAARTQDAARGAKLAAKVVATLARAEARTEAAETLAEMGERSLAGKDASLP